MGETITIRTSASTDVIKVVEQGPQGPAGSGGAGDALWETGVVYVELKSGGGPGISIPEYGFVINAEESFITSSADLSLNGSIIVRENSPRLVTGIGTNITIQDGPDSGAFSGGNGGTINLSGGSAANVAQGFPAAAGGNSGSINLSGGSPDMQGTAGVGGSIDLSASGAFGGGSIDLSAGGGSIDLSGGGGSINTRGTGSIGLGNSGTRTTLTGTATADRAISLPNASGTLALEEPVDNVFRIVGSSDATKKVAFEVDGLTAATTRTLTVPNASGTISLEGHTHAASDITSGTFDNARINFAAPSAIGSTTSAAGTFTTLTGSTQIVGPQGSTVGSTSSNAITLGAANTGFYVSSTQLAAAKQGAVVWYANNTGVFVVAAGMTNGMQIEQTGAPLSFSRNIALFPDANGELHQRSTTQAQSKIIYGTYTSGTNYQRLGIRSVRQTLSALSGASATTTGTFIPDGAVVVGVTTRVATALTGATGYQVGDGTDADRWGDITGTAIGTATDNRDWTAGTIECFTAGGNVTLTAKGSNFTAGAVEICVFYLAGEAD